METGIFGHRICVMCHLIGALLIVRYHSCTLRCCGLNDFGAGGKESLIFGTPRREKSTGRSGTNASRETAAQGGGGNGE